MQRDASFRDYAGHAYAGLVSRAVAFGIDLVAVVLTIMVVSSLAIAVEGFFPGHVFTGVRAAITLATAVFSAVFHLAYWLACWTLFGQTPGMMLMGLRIVRTDGRKMTLRRALIRYVGCLLSALLLCLGFLWILIDSHRQGWHDKLSGTYVIYLPSRATHHLTERRLPAAT
jgi:uncharacterized RDD family membrane protein YckC